jgi:hypothetical protein
MSLTSVFTTTKARNVIRMTVASAVGSAVAWVAVKYGKLTTGSLALLAPAISAAYFAVIHYLETKFPSLGWLLGLLPQKKVVTLVTPTPAPVKTARKSTTKAIKAAKKATKKA